MDIQRKVRDHWGQFNDNRNSIAIFPDYTASVAKARAAFTKVEADWEYTMVSSSLLGSASPTTTKTRSSWMLPKLWTTKKKGHPSHRDGELTEPHVSLIESCHMNMFT